MSKKKRKKQQEEKAKAAEAAAQEKKLPEDKKADSKPATDPESGKISPVLPKRVKPKFKDDEFRSSAYSMMNIVEQGRKATPLFTKFIAGLLVIILLFGAVCVGMYKYREYKAAEAFRKEIEGMEKQIRLLDEKASTSEGYAKYKAVQDAINWIDTASSMDLANPEKWFELREKHLKMFEGSKPAKGSDYVVPTGGIDMAFIPQGRFFMGRKPNEAGGQSDEVPRRAVTLAYDFWMSRTEITNQQLKESNPGHRTEPWSGYRLDRLYQPAVLVDWHLASAFCAMLTKKEEKAKRIPENYEYRLPTEAEWEYACRAGTETIYYWGDAFGDTGALYANIMDYRTAKIFGWTGEKGMPANDGNIVTAIVGSYKPNAFGLHDMIGNVWEWCWDWYNPTAYQELPEVNPVQVSPVVTDVEVSAGYGTKYNVSSPSKVIRGGSWGNVPSECRIAGRDSMLAETKNTGIGFRIVLAPKISSITTAPVKKEAP